MRRSKPQEATASLPAIYGSWRTGALTTALHNSQSMHQISHPLLRSSSSVHMFRQPKRPSELHRHPSSSQLLSRPVSAVTLTRSSSHLDSRLDMNRPKSRGSVRARTPSSFKALEVGRPPFKSWSNPDTVFDIIDDDRSGYVDREELFRFFRGRLDPAKIEELFSKLDEDNSGSVSRDEWIKGYYEAGFGQGAIVGQSAEGLGVLLNLIPSHFTVDFADLHEHRPPRRIPKAEQRGITLTQLRALMAHVRGRCEHEAWVGMDGRRLTTATVTLYEVVRYVIKPCTQGAQSSYIERVSQDAQQPVWFVCNWWGDSFQKVLDCLEQHARDRGVPDHCPYWISAFAHNQWDINPSACWTSSHKALAECIGTVTIVDQKGACLKRAWCLYETYLSLCKAEHKWDLYTPLHHVCVTSKRIDGTRHRQCTAVGLLQDYGTADFHACQVNKAARESFFPLELTALGLRVNLVDAHTSVEVDRHAILNAVAGQPLHGAPLAEHERYEQVSSVLAGRIALASLRCAANLGDGPAYQNCLRAISQSGASKIAVGFSSCKAFTASMASTLIRALPTTVTLLTCLFRDVDDEAGKELVTSLAAGMTRGEHPCLKHLTLESNTIDADCMRDLGAALMSSGLPKLHSISFGMPCPFNHEAASTLALVAYGQLCPKISFCGERIPRLSNIALPKLGLTSADLILLVASMASGSCGMVSALDISENKIDNNGMRALELALKPGTKAYNQCTINLNTIDLSNNSFATKLAKNAVFEARKAVDDSTRGRNEPGASAKANVVRTAVAFRLAAGYEFRIEPLRDA